MVDQPRPLRRDQIAAFVGNDQEAILAVEKLFRAVNTLQGDSGDVSPMDFSNAQQAIADLTGRIIVGDTAQATAQAALAALQGVNQTLALLALAPPPQPLNRTAWGTFFDLNTQNAAVINTAYSVSFSNTDLSRGVYLAGSPATRITVDQAGLYDFQHSIQIDKTTGGKGLFYLWYRKNGVDVSNSATRVRLEGNNSENVASWNYVFDLQAGDYIEYRWAVNDTGVEIKYFTSSAPVPAIPSCIVSVTNNIKGQQ